MSIFFCVNFSKQPLLLLVIVGLALGCRDYQYSSKEQVTELEKAEENQSSEKFSIRTLVRSKKEANLVLQEKSLPEIANWEGFYQSIQQKNRSVLDGSFQIVSEQKIEEYPDTSIITTYTGQYLKGSRYGEFVKTVNSLEAETKYSLVYDSNGKCERGVINQKGEGSVIERIVEKPSPCTFETLSNI